MTAPLTLLIAALLGSADASGPEIPVADAASSIDKELIRRVIRKHLGEVRACYAAGLARDPSLRGRIVLHFVIAATGKVTSSSITSSDLGDDAVGQCIADAALGWRFVGGLQIAVSYPFVFVPPNEASSANAK